MNKEIANMQNNSLKSSIVKATLVAAVLISQTAVAGPTFDNITSNDFENISKEMSANFAHSSILGASKMGTVLGVQVGLVAAQTASPKTDAIVKREAAGSELPNMYNAGLLVAVGIPFGIAFEGVLIPETGSNGAKISTTSLGVKYNINDVIPVLPVNLALRGVYTISQFKFDQTQGAVNTSIKNKNSMYGVQLLISPMLPIVEPYAGLGYLSATNTLEATGSAVFDPSYTSGSSETKNISSTQILAGVDINLLLIKLGAEYSQAFGTNRYAAKIAFGF